MKKITVARARRLFVTGHTLYLLPSKVALENPWVAPMAVSNRYFDRDFDAVVNEYHYYVSPELGHVTFWIEEES